MAPPGDAAGSKVVEDDKKYSRSTRRMTPELLLEICKERKMWCQPHLNTQLYLNYKGFDTIEGLEDYTKVRALHLGNNNIAKIEGLDRMSDLRTLHLENNRIKVIENMSGLLDLRQLNLEANAISQVSGLEKLTKLEHLNLARNAIENLEDLEGLRPVEGLSNIDISHNQLEATEGVLEFWESLADRIKVLRYHGNPGVRKIENYRKRLINALPNVSYLDERPVFPMERRSSAAWREGGMDAMHAAKREFLKDRNRMQSYVDPERRELLTNMRKAAIARIEREAKEREAEEEAKKKEAEEASAAKKAGTGGIKIEEECPAAEGDWEALNDYAKKWQTKVSLLGEDGVREQVAREDGAQANLKPASAATGLSSGGGAEQAEKQQSAPAGAGAEAADDDEIPTLSEPSKPTGPSESYKATGSANIRPAAYNFAPSNRAHTEGGGAASSSGAGRSTRWAHLRGAEASDFMVKGASDRTGSVEDHQDRLFEVLGGDNWTLGGPSSPSGGSRPGAGGLPDMAGKGHGKGWEKDEEVMPLIWQRLAPAAKEAEAKALEMNMKPRTEEEAPAPRELKTEDIHALD